jgi:Protein of unknown function (DUF1612)/HTH DNA binding domain
VTNTYAVHEILTLSTWRRLAGPVERASDSVVRLDERLARAEPVLADGVRARAHLFDAQATLHLEGRLVPLEDLVLHDAQMDRRPPTPEVSRAAMVLAARRRIAMSTPGWPFSPEGQAGLLAVRARESEGNPDDARGGKDLAAGSTNFSRRREEKPSDMPRFGGDDLLDADEDDEEDEPAWKEPLEDEGASDGPTDEAFAELDRLIARTRRSLSAFNDLLTDKGRRGLTVPDPAFREEEKLRAWHRAALDDTRGLPSVLAAAVTLDAWFLLDPSERRGHLGPLMAAALLRARGKTPAHLPALALGLRESGVRWSKFQSAAERLEGVICGIEEAARHAARDLDKLTIARELMLRHCAGKRKTSRLSQLVDLFVSAPLVTVATAAKALKTTPQAVEAMLADLGSACPRELTERKRYRAWGIL